MSINPKNINIIKILLDIIMSVLLVLMFNKSVINLEFHEIGGLFACGFFLIHSLINWRWITAVSKRLFNKDLPFKQRFKYCINFLLLISVLLILISGIFISKIVFAGFFSFSSSINWRAIHYFASACSLILIGIHLGMNWGFVMGIFSKFIKMPSALAKPISIILVLAIVSFGSYSLVTSSFTRWISSPFTTSQQKGGFDRPMNVQKDTSNNETEQISPDKNNDEDNGLLSEQDNELNNMQNSGQNNEQDNQGKGNRPNRGNGFNKGERPSDFYQKGDRVPQDGTGFPGKGNRGPQDGSGFPGKGGHGGNSNVLSVILTFTSIIGLFSAITYYIEKLIKKIKKPKYIILDSQES